MIQHDRIIIRFQPGLREDQIVIVAFLMLLGEGVDNKTRRE